MVKYEDIGLQSKVYVGCHAIVIMDIQAVLEHSTKGQRLDAETRSA